MLLSDPVGETICTLSIVIVKCMFQCGVPVLFFLFFTLLSSGAFLGVDAHWRFFGFDVICLELVDVPAADVVI